MIINPTDPTKYRRTLMVDVTTANPTQPGVSSAASASTEVILSIHMIVDDGMQVTEAIFSGAPERELLWQFWRSVRTNDVFYGYEVVDCLALLRRRAWAWSLLPSREMTLSTVYRHHAIDTAGLESSASDAGYRSAEALASVLGLP